MVGASGPLAPSEIGEPLFTPTAHHFTVWTPAGLSPPAYDAIRRAIDNLNEAAQELGLTYELNKVTDLKQIMALGVMMTPALAAE